MEASTEDRNASIALLRPKTKALIGEMLNPHMFIEAPNGVLRYWKGLAALCKIRPDYEAGLCDSSDPTSKVLALWYEQDAERSTVHQFLLFLEEMDRFDVIEDVLELIDQDIEFHKLNPNQYSQIKPLYSEADKHIITIDDVERVRDGRPLEIYDAFLLYDQEDIDFAIKLLEVMEKKYGLKFVLRDRDLVGGGLEMDKMIKLITERCNRLVVILSDSFFKSSANEYYLSFAQAYGIECQRKIIPCIYKELGNLPYHMKCLFTLDYRRMAIFNFWGKLKDSIVTVDAEKWKINRSKSDDGNTLRSALHESNNSNSVALKPLNQVKFSSSVGNLNTLEPINEPALNPSTSADNLEIPTNMKKEKKFNTWYKKIFKGNLKKDKSNDCVKAEKQKTKGFRKHIKRAAVVAN